MKKQVKNWHGKNYYLLGINQYNEKEWLEESSFDCGWYWGIGYIETFNRNWTVNNSHFHFDSQFLNNDKSFCEYYKEYYKETTFNKNEMWTLYEIMKSLYVLRDYSDILHSKGSHITSNPCKDLMGNDDEYKRINEVVIPSLLNELYKLLSNEESEGKKINDTTRN